MSTRGELEFFHNLLVKTNAEANGFESLKGFQGTMMFEFDLFQCYLMKNGEHYQINRKIKMTSKKIFCIV